MNSIILIFCVYASHSARIKDLLLTEVLVLIKTYSCSENLCFVFHNLCGFMFEIMLTLQMCILPFLQNILTFKLMRYERRFIQRQEAQLAQLPFFLAIYLSYKPYKLMCRVYRGWTKLCFDINALIRNNNKNISYK